MCTNAQISSSTLHPTHAYVQLSDVSSMQAVPQIYIKFSWCTTTDCNTPPSSWAAYCNGAATNPSSSSSSNVKPVVAGLAAAAVAVMTFL